MENDNTTKPESVMDKVKSAVGSVSTEGVRSKVADATDATNIFVDEAAGLIESLQKVISDANEKIKNDTVRAWAVPVALVGAGVYLFVKHYKQ